VRDDAAPERWEAESDGGDVLQLHVPPHANRDRVFEVSFSFEVRWRGDDADADEAWHGLRVLVNGQQEWQRRVPTTPGSSDSLDYRFRRVVPNGEALRLVAMTEVKLAQRRRIRITAEEER
jgi:hypothetical protein